MRVLIVNTAERTGGAAIAANRLMHALNHNGVEARMLVRDRKTDATEVVNIPPSSRLKANFLWERGVIWLNNGLSKQNLFQVDIANAGTDITTMPDFKWADVIHLHWVNQGFLSLNDLERIMASGKPIVITMHDQWYFTGICHYSGECSKYQKQCEKCPMLKNIGMDLAQHVFDRKRAMYEGKNVTFVGCSRWMADLARKSPLTQGHLVTNIPNAIDTDVFTPMDKLKARKKHNLPTDKKLLLFGAQRITDERKGFSYLVEACEHISKHSSSLSRKLGVVVLGGDATSVKEALPLPVYPVNYLSNEAEIAELYNAVDLFVTPSLQDNLPNTIVEAMACGTPCVGFNVGGIPEMISHKQNGYVADYCDSIDFAQGIAWCLSETRHANLCAAACTTAHFTYAESVVASRYKDIYPSTPQQTTTKYIDPKSVILCKQSKETRCYIISALMLFDGYHQIDEMINEGGQLYLDALGLTIEDVRKYPMPDYAQIVSHLKPISDSVVRNWVIMHTYASVLNFATFESLNMFEKFCLDLKWDPDEIEECMDFSEELSRIPPLRLSIAYTRWKENNNS